VRQAPGRVGGGGATSRDWLRRICVLHSLLSLRGGRLARRKRCAHATSGRMRARRWHRKSAGVRHLSGALRRSLRRRHGASAAVSPAQRNNMACAMALKGTEGRLGKKDAEGRGQHGALKTGVAVVSYRGLTGMNVFHAGQHVDRLLWRGSYSAYSRRDCSSSSVTARSIAASKASCAVSGDLAAMRCARKTVLSKLAAWQRKPLACWRSGRQTNACSSQQAS